MTIIANAAQEERLVALIRDLGASGYTAMPCQGAGRREPPASAQVRIEVIAPSDIAERILESLARGFSGDDGLTACSETVDVLRPEQF